MKKFLLTGVAGLALCGHMAAAEVNADAPMGGTMTVTYKDDVATLDPDGYMTIRDRSKDIIKSGGEWISSVELENIAVGHPKLANAAVIGVHHPKWDERPVLVAVAAEGQSPTEEELLAWFDGKIAHWQIPDKVVFIEALPLNATGKVLKRDLRDQFEGILDG